MAAFSSVAASRLATLPTTFRVGLICQQNKFSVCARPMFCGLKQISKIQRTKSYDRFSTGSRCFRIRTAITCSAHTETLKTVQDTIAKQLSVEVTAVTPETKFADLGADSLDLVEIMMALEEQFGVSIGEGGAENIVTVQDAADLIEKVKTAA